MGFDDLEEAEKQRQQTDQASSSSDASAGSESSTESSGSVDEPAFEYADVKQSPMYARPEAWDALQDTLDLEVIRELRDAGVRNEEKRELHDAALWVAAQHPEEIAEAVQAARRGDR